MYQSLYRIWRPKTFSDLKGQEHITRTLKNQVAAGRWGHAYLFSGSRGTGKTSAARILAMAVNCRDLQGGDPCLTCEACKALQSDTTLDVFEMDAASNSRVEEIRELLEKVNYPPQFVANKVYIIDEVHMLSNAAFNALLKTLEEPPEYMVFILATTEPQKIPATILSRCQRFDFGRLREEDIIQRLRVAFGPDKVVQDEALRLIAFAAEGSMRDAWSLTDMCLDENGNLHEASVREAIGAVDGDFMVRFVDTLGSGNAAGAVEMIQQLLAAGKDPQVFLKEVAQHLRLVIATRLGAPPPGVGDSLALALRNQAASVPLEKMTWMLERAMRAEGDLRWAAQARTVLTVYALSCCRPQWHDEPLALEARLAQLEAQLALLAGAEPRLPSDPAPTPAAPPRGLPPAAPQQPPRDAPPAHEDSPPVKLPPAEAAPRTETLPQAPPGVKAEAAADAKAPPAGDNTPKSVWNAMLQRARKELPSIYSILNEGRYGGFSDGVYRLQFTKDNQSLVNFVMLPDRREIIERILSDVSGSPVQFEALSQQAKVHEVSAQQKAQLDIQTLADLFGRKNIIVEGHET